MPENQHTLRKVRSYQDLKVWQLGMGIAKEVYQLTGAFPKHETYGMTSQLRRAATSIPANIAEVLRRIICDILPTRLVR